jgi:hypothetical protein
MALSLTVTERTSRVIATDLNISILGECRFRVARHSAHHVGKCQKNRGAQPWTLAGVRRFEPESVLLMARSVILLIVSQVFLARAALRLHPLDIAS